MNEFPRPQTIVGENTQKPVHSQIVLSFVETSKISDIFVLSCVSREREPAKVLYGASLQLFLN